MEDQAKRAPDFESTVTTGGVDHVVRTWCDTVPPNWEGTCAAFHWKKITDLREASGGGQGG